MVESVYMDNSRILMTFKPLIVRLVLGTLIIINGWPKLINLKQTQGYFNMMGLPEEMGLLTGPLELRS